jgi:signal transduction histidine kinase
MIQVTETARLHERSTAMNQELLLSGVRQHELTEVAEKLTEQLQSEIGERRRMEQVLVNTEKLAVMARFALMMAHEINNPLEAITNLMFLLAPLQSSSEAEGYMRTLEEQIKGLNRISTQMLKFHRDSNKPTQFALRALVRDVLDFYHPQADRRGVIVDPRIETEGRVAGFRTEIVQVLTNLLLNAIDATSVGGHVIVHLYPAPSWLCRIHNKLGYCISIADSGGGIDPQHKAKIFEPFFTTKGDRGTGLGLWVSLGIVTGAGGSIRVRSTRRAGRSGTCFSVFLPAEQAERKNS